MSNSRELILGRIKKATTALPQPTKYPEFEPSMVTSKSGHASLASDNLVETFSTQWQENKGRWASDWESLVQLLSQSKPNLGYCAPDFEEKVHATWPEAPISTTFDRAQVNAYDFGITPAWGAIAETGTIILTDTQTPTRLGALAPWTHVAVIPKENIFPTLAAAIAALPNDPSIIFVTGPSKTADIEGILIEGVHGPGIQIAIPI
jgi:L-lactate dehydrogenase complex protein LldG